jgi:hypothetical protein
VTATRWVEAMRRLNSIKDPLARQLLRLHENCGSGLGVCDGPDGGGVAIPQRAYWGCETTELIATHFGVEYPRGPQR